MKRREFLQSTLAAAALPAIPMPALATVTTAPKVNIAAKYWASYFATPTGQHALNAVQAGMNVSPLKAQQLVRKFVARGHVSPAAMVTHMAQLNQVVVQAKPAAARAKPIRFKGSIDLDDVPKELRNLRANIECDCDMAAATDQSN